MQGKMTRRKVINIHCKYLWRWDSGDYLLLYTFLYLSNIFSEHVFLLQLVPQTLQILFYKQIEQVNVS